MMEVGLVCIQSDVGIDRTKIQEGWKDLMAMPRNSLPFYQENGRERSFLRSYETF